MNPWRRSSFVSLMAVLVALLAGCGDGDHPTKPAAPARTYVMGFSSFPPRASIASIVQTIDAFAPHADAALIVTEPPWDSLLAGRSPDSLIRNNQVGLANYFRGKGLNTIVVSVDPTNGLDRASESAPLAAAGRSLTEPAIQALFRGYVVAMDTLIHPAYISVASETNLIRAAAPGALYDAVVQVANDAAADVRAHDPSVKVFTTVQVETAWGRAPGVTGPYVGIGTDRTDFPFVQLVGLSSFPYLGGFTLPDSIPLDYYSRLVEGDPLPQMVVEGGWSSDSTARWIPWSDPPIMNVETQARYIARHAAILDRAQAIGWFQITFTDLDLASLGFPASAVPFASLGLVDVDLNPKAALSAWDKVFQLPRR